MSRQFGSFVVDGTSLMPVGKATKVTPADITNYEASVLGMLHSFEAIQAGRALMDGFRTCHQKIWVLPYDMPDIDECQAEVDSSDLFGTQVFFTPRMWFGASPCSTGQGAGNSPHEVLYHELVHAVRSVAGILAKSTTLDEEERIAVMVTNIFASETHRPLRKDHDSFAVNSDPVTSTSAGFLHANHRLIHRFVKDHGRVSALLSKVNSPFNPVREYYKVHHKKA